MCSVDALVPEGGGSVVPLFVATVDNAVYRERLAKTVAHLRERGAAEIYPVPLLDVTKVNYRKSRVLMAGWREILLPYLLAQRRHSGTDDMVIVLEDDARLACSVGRLCAVARGALEVVDVASLGHSWYKMATQGTPFHLPLKEAPPASVHATTCLAFRGSRLSEVHRLFQTSCLGHLDDFLFRRSPMPIALRDPPIVGWATEAVTLTNAHAHGAALPGGGRRGSMPLLLVLEKENNEVPPPPGLWRILRFTDQIPPPPPHLLRVVDPGDVILPPGTRHISELVVFDQGTTPRPQVHEFPGLTDVDNVRDLFDDDDDDDDEGGGGGGGVLG
mmetsp:Transcript_38734/g.124168  ORF Transcript_38734/g.124168 Transcript_38734/m.124168 type:complete len:331 (-) Transcript_38734:7-999(-)